VAFEIILHEAEESVALAPVEPDDGGEVAHLFRRELWTLREPFMSWPMLRRRASGRVLAVGGLVAVEVPKLDARCGCRRSHL